MKQRSFNVWFYFGAIGLLVFLVMRPLIDFNASSPINKPVSEIKEKVSLISEALGINSDSLSIALKRQQLVSQYSKIKDSLSITQSPSKLQQIGVPLTSWVANLIVKNEVISNDPTENLKEKSPITIVLNDFGNVVSVSIANTNENLTFIEGDSLNEISESLIQNVFGFSLDNYSLINNSNNESTSTIIIEENEKNQNQNVIQNNGVFDYSWVKNDLSKVGPIEIHLKLKPTIKKNNLTASIQSGVHIERFETFYIDKALESSTDIPSTFEALFFVTSLLILIVLITIVTVRQIFKGMVEWKRGFIMLFMGIILMGIWKGFYLLQTPVFEMSSMFVVSFIFNTLLYSLVFGVYTAMAYMAWDSLARKHKHRQLKVIDAFWNGKLFYKETGESIYYGYSLTGVVLGVMSLALFSFQLVYHQYDNLSGYVEATSLVPFFSITINALGIAVFGLIGHFGVITAFIQEIVKNQKVRHVLTVIVSGVLLSGLGRFFGTSGAFFIDIIIYICISIPLYIAYNQFGYLTVTISWFAFAMVIFMMPLFNLDSISVFVQFMILFGVLITPLIFSFIANIYGDRLDDEQVYIPEYEEKISRQLRFEKEIEIARESQFELLPVNTPELPEAMICGFFIPSFEVGGDYYDYFLKYDSSNNPKSLATTVVDVSGKAMKAAMHAVHTSGLILSRFPTDTPEQVLTAINPFVHSKTDKRTFITCITAEYFFESKVIRIANAGHCLPILKRNGKATFIETPTPKYPLGIKKEVLYNSIELQLIPGDVILFYSDGLPEAQDTKLQRFGFDSVLTLMEEIDTVKGTSSEICQLIKRRIQTFSAYQMVDDTTIVALKII